VFDIQLTSVISGVLFKKIMSNEQLTMLEFNFLTNNLMANNIPFETSFVSGTRKNPASIQLTIHINPSTTLVIVVSVEPGSSVFSPSP